MMKKIKNNLLGIALTYGIAITGAVVIGINPVTVVVMVTILAFAL